MQIFVSPIFRGKPSITDLEHTGRIGYISDELVLEQLARDKSQSTRKLGEPLVLAMKPCASI